MVKGFLELGLFKLIPLLFLAFVLAEFFHFQGKIIAAVRCGFATMRTRARESYDMLACGERFGTSGPLTFSCSRAKVKVSQQEKEFRDDDDDEACYGTRGCFHGD